MFRNLAVRLFLVVFVVQNGLPGNRADGHDHAANR
jgi:hypothetical protein